MTLAVLALLPLLAASPAELPPCEVTGRTVAAHDVTRAEAACAVAQARFEQLFGAPVPDVHVILWDQPGYRNGVQNRRAVIYWPTGEALARAGGGANGPFGADAWGEVLPHEIAHVLLAARFFPTAAATPPGGYGSPLPDWLDEAVAIWAEPASARRARLRDARALPEAGLDLARALEEPHPAVSDPLVLALRDGGTPADPAALEAFYPRALALLGFVFDRGGQPATRELAARLARDPSAGIGALAGLPGFPETPQGLAEDWRRWLALESQGSAAAR